MFTASELTSGERVLLQRRRAGRTVVQAAKFHGVSLYRYKRWEAGTEPAPAVSVGRLAFFERALILRRRAGLSVSAFAKRLGVSAWWVTQMEAGKVTDGRLRGYWGGKPSRRARGRSPAASARRRRKTT